MTQYNLQKLAASRDRSTIDYILASPEERAHLDRIQMERDQKMNDAFKKQLNGWKDKGSNFYNRLISGKNS